MKLRHLRNETLSGSILLVVLASFLTFWVEPADAASEPGAVTIVLAQEPTNCDPGSTSDSDISVVLLKNIVETLTEINPDDSSITPRLATAWKQIDANTWHFVLRKGVKFHDGEDFNAESLLFNFKRLYDKRTISSTRNKFFSNFKMDGRALDSHTVEVKTDKPQPLLPTLMGILAICSPNTPLDKLTRNPIGTGPYKFVKWDGGMQVILERIDGYWGKQPPVKKAIYIWRKESSVRAAMVDIGEADLVPSIARQDANRPDMDQSYLNSETVSIRIGGAWEPPLNDRRVRMALNLAVDRDGLRGSVVSKDAIPASQIVPPSTAGYNPDLKPWPYDPQKARQLLNEARKDGVPVDKEIALVGRIAWWPGGDELMEAVMTMYKAVGLNVKLKMLEVGVYRPYTLKPFPPEPYLTQGSHDNNKGDAGFSVFFKYHSTSRQCAFSDKMVDDLIEKAEVATGEQRRNLWRAVFKRLHEELISDVMLFHMVGYCRVGKRINFKPSMATVNEIQLAHITFR